MKHSILLDNKAVLKYFILATEINFLWNSNEWGTSVSISKSDGGKTDAKSKCPNRYNVVMYNTF